MTGSFGYKSMLGRTEAGTRRDGWGYLAGETVQDTACCLNPSDGVRKRTTKEADYLSVWGLLWRNMEPKTPSPGSLHRTSGRRCSGLTATSPICER